MSIPRRSRRLRAVALIAACALVLAACGDDDAQSGADETSDSIATTTSTGAASTTTADTQPSGATTDDVALVCANWGRVVPFAPSDAVGDLLTILGADAPPGVIDALEELRDADVDNGTVRARLEQVAQYIDPICGTDTPPILALLEDGAEPIACATVAPPTGELRSEVTADVDGDGVADTAQLFLVDDSTIGLHVLYGAGGSATLTVVDEAVSGIGNTRIETVLDMEGDGDGDLWVFIGVGASSEIATLVLAEPCTLVRPDSPDGGPNTFTVGGSLAGLSGIECRDIDGNGANDTFIAWSGTRSDDDGNYAGNGSELVVDGQALVELDQIPFTTGPNDPDSSQYSSFNC